MNVFVALVAAVGAYLLISAAFEQPNARSRKPRSEPPRTRRRSSSLAERLQHSGITMSTTRYRLTVVGSMFVIFVVVLAITGTPSLAVPPAIAVAMAPRAFYRRRQAKVLRERVAAWPEAIRDVLAHLAAGHTLQASLALLGRSGPDQLRPVWTRFERNSAALDVASALELVRSELADPVSDKVVEAFVAAHERGQSVIIAVLRSLADNVSRDVQTAEQIITSQVEVRAQAALAAVMPFGVLAFLVAANESYRSFYRSPVGWFVVGMGALMALGGWKLISAIGKLPLEPRVLGAGR